MYQIGSVEYGDELFHHGIKGMKWGIRRTPEELGHKPSNSLKNSPPKKRVKITDVSDDRLKSMTDRRKRENDYRAEVVRTKKLKREASGLEDRNQKAQRRSAMSVAFVQHVLGTAVKGVFDVQKSVVLGAVSLGKQFIQSVFNKDLEW